MKKKSLVIRNKFAVKTLKDLWEKLNVISIKPMNGGYLLTLQKGA